MKYFIASFVGIVVGCAIVVGSISVGGIVGGAGAVAILILIWIAILANGNTP